LRDILNQVPDIALVIYGGSAWNGFHTFFLPNNHAFSKVIDRNRIDREVLLAHVTGMNRVLFTQFWLHDGGVHYYPSVQFSANIVEDNFKLKLTLRNITDRRTGRWDSQFFFQSFCCGSMLFLLRPGLRVRGFLDLFLRDSWIPPEAKNYTFYRWALLSDGLGSLPFLRSGTPPP
jgi:hypothetical protein